MTDKFKYKKNLKDLPITTTAHGIGQKRIIINKEETNTPLTQIAVTQIKAERKHRGTSASHNGRILLFQKGDAIITIDKEQLACSNGDFISIPANTLHSLKAITDIEIITIGCAIF